MKQIGYTTVALVTVLVILLSVVTGASASQFCGDIDQNGAIDSLDLRILMQYMVGERSLTAAERQLADCDKNNRVDTKDARCVLGVIAFNETPSTLPTTTTTTVPTTTTTKPPLDDDGYYDEIVKP